MSQWKKKKIESHCSGRSEGYDFNFSEWINKPPKLKWLHLYHSWGVVTGRCCVSTAPGRGVTPAGTCTSAIRRMVRGRENTFKIYPNTQRFCQDQRWETKWPPANMCFPVWRAGDPLHRTDKRLLTLPTRYPVQDAPPDVKHGGVMVDVKKGDLAGFLPQHKENCVQELY